VAAKDDVRVSADSRWHEILDEDKIDMAYLLGLIGDGTRTYSYMHEFDLCVIMPSSFIDHDFDIPKRESKVYALALYDVIRDANKGMEELYTPTPERPTIERDPETGFLAPGPYRDAEVKRLRELRTDFSASVDSFLDCVREMHQGGQLI